MNETGNQSEQEAINAAVETLIKLRDEYSDEVPDQMVHSNDEDNKYKVRGAWYQGVSANVEEILGLKGIDREDVPEIQELIEYFTDRNDEFNEKLKNRTDVSDIEKGNRLIELGLNLVEK